MIVQGRYDLLCPPATAHALADRWPEARVHIAEMSGHRLSHAAVHAAVKRAISSFNGQAFDPPQSLPA